MDHDKDEVTPFQLFRWCCRVVNWEFYHRTSRLIDRKTKTYWCRWIYCSVRKLHFFHQRKKKNTMAKTGFDRTLQPLVKEVICKRSLRIKPNFIFPPPPQPQSVLFHLLCRLLKFRLRTPQALKELSGQGFSANWFLSLGGYAPPWAYAKWPLQGLPVTTWIFLRLLQPDG